jgi:type II pantothenate kinase
VHLHQGGSDHLGGISVGGGMLEGLGNIIMNEPSGIILNKYAQNGDRSGLDVMIGEAVNEIGKLNAQITASNFGKSKILVDKSQDNLSAALCNMIGEVIGTVAYLNALLIGANKAYFLGRTSMLSEVKNGIDERLKLAGVEGIYADNRSFGNAIGVMASIEK